LKKKTMGKGKSKASGRQKRFGKKVLRQNPPNSGKEKSTTHWEKVDMGGGEGEGGT